MVSRQPRKQRARLYSTPVHRRNKLMSARLSKELREKYKIKSLPVRKGDRVKILRGDFKKLEGEVLEVNPKKQTITVQGATITKSDGSQVNRPIHPSNVMLLKLVEDKERIGKLTGRSESG
ncbi:MAG: 50S ribosomal protein L24 [Candidatus Hadarchaeum sp.]|uniref:50S ribosomal protein L24 n=1 Tax=Candidatus Hadarchaeum sp. TaxID=2883567 RepID=UPI003176AAC6